MRKIQVLILEMGGNVSQGILKAVRQSGIFSYLVGAYVSRDAAGLYMCDQAYISPYAAEKSFLPWLYGLCLSEPIDIVFSNVEVIIDVVSPDRDELF